MPFLVDSLELALTRLGHAIYVTIHPQLHVTRSPRGEITSIEAGENGKVESFIHFEVVRETDPALLATIEAALARTLRDVREAVEDWQEMLDRLRSGAAELRATPDLPDDLKAESGAFLEWLARRSLHAARLPRVRARRRRRLRHARAAREYGPRPAARRACRRGRETDGECAQRGALAHAARDHEVERALDRAPRRHARSRRHQSVRWRRAAACRAALPRSVHVERVPPKSANHSAAADEDRDDHERVGPRPAQPPRQVFAAHPRHAAARRFVPSVRRGAACDRERRAIARATAQAEAVLPARDVRPLLLVPRLPASRSIQLTRAARDRERPARGAPRQLRRKRAHDLRVRACAARGDGADARDRAA